MSAATKRWGVRIKYANGGTDYVGPFGTRAEATTRAREIRERMGSAVRSVQVRPEDEE